jgi:hypothetical protein
MQKVHKTAITFTFYSVILFSLLLEAVLLFYKHQSLIKIVNITELILSLWLSVMVLILIKHSFLKYVTLGVALALISWTFGELFTLSYTHITGSNILYPAIADFGYIGFYLMISSALGILKRVDVDDVNKAWQPYLVFTIILIPIALMLSLSNSIFVNTTNFIYSFLSALVIYQSVILIRLKLYPYIIGSVIFIALLNMIFIVTINMRPSCHFITILFPIGFAGILLGVLKHNGDQL